MSAEMFMQCSQDLLDVFNFNGYCVESAIQLLSPTAPITPVHLAKINLKAPANLWSQQVLRYHKDVPSNDFENKILSAYADRVGLSYEVISTAVSNNIDVLHTAKIMSKYA